MLTGPGFVDDQLEMERFALKIVHSVTRRPDNQIRRAVRLSPVRALTANLSPKIRLLDIPIVCFGTISDRAKYVRRRHCARARGIAGLQWRRRANMAAMIFAIGGSVPQQQFDNAAFAGLNCCDGV